MIKLFDTSLIGINEVFLPPELNREDSFRESM